WRPRSGSPGAKEPIRPPTRCIRCEAPPESLKPTSCRSLTTTLSTCPKRWPPSRNSPFPPTSARSWPTRKRTRTVRASFLPLRPASRPSHRRSSASADRAARSRFGNVEYPRGRRGPRGYRCRPRLQQGWPAFAVADKRVRSARTRPASSTSATSRTVDGKPWTLRTMSCRCSTGGSDTDGTDEKHVRPDPSHRNARGARGLREIGVLGAISVVAVTDATDTSPCRSGQCERQRPEQLVVGAGDDVAIG